MPKDKFDVRKKKFCPSCGSRIENPEVSQCGNCGFDFEDKKSKDKGTSVSERKP